MTDTTDWQAFWKNNDIGFHLDQPNPLLVKHWPKIRAMPGNMVFVPLCGKTLDMVELHQQGHFVLGAELSDIAVEAFFAEQKLKSNRQKAGEHEYWSSDNLAIIHGDFFTLTESSVPARFVYDRAALVALPPKMQEQYVAQLLRIAPDIEQILLLTIEYDHPENIAPPYVITPDRVHELFGEHFEIDLLESKDTRPSDKKQKMGLSVITEHAFKLDRK
ncbi:thiopurine S-methyltransferase [Endozoicomonas ascidiicola]|uniref:thiopurine S-methyltransferase n=1 Tax=Endozoicomonas ascidiicola TaxID=1698521 RepID=UPI000834C775|nr:thiopurine S-methyltransferase [Endozoicomonas ascidiicola]